MLKFFFLVFFPAFFLFSIFSTRICQSITCLPAIGRIGDGRTVHTACAARIVHMCSCARMRSMAVPIANRTLTSTTSYNYFEYRSRVKRTPRNLELSKSWGSIKLVPSLLMKSRHRERLSEDLQMGHLLQYLAHQSIVGHKFLTTISCHSLKYLWSCTLFILYR